MYRIEKKGVKLLRSRRRRGRRHAGAGLSNTGRTLLTLAALLLAGALVGALLARQAAASGKSSFGNVLSASFSAETVSKSFLSLAFSSFSAGCLLLICTFLLALCAAGAPGLLAVPFFKGAGLGFSIGYLYALYGLRGVTLSAMCILPEGLIASLAVLVACRAGLRFSIRLGRVILPDPPQEIFWDDFMSLCGTFAFCLVLTFIGSLLGAVIIRALSGYLIA